MLCNDYVLHGAVELLEKVARRIELRLDRTIEISVTNTTEKKKHRSSGLGPTWRPSATCLAQNQRRLTSALP